MKNAPEKKGFDAGLLPVAQKVGPPVEKRPGAGYTMQPADRDQAIWTDSCNFEPNLAHGVPMDGLDATVWELFKGKVNYS